MATGYTQSVVDGEVEFPTFALQCARAFGALVSFRELPLTTRLPYVIKPSDYHLLELQRTKAELTTLENASYEDITLLSITVHTQESALYQQSLARQQAEHKRLLAMKNSVLTWTPPTTEHEGLKKFMLEQLDGTLAGYGYQREEPKPISPSLYRQEKVVRLKKDIAYHATEYDYECAKATEQTKWLQQLRESLLL